MDVEAFKDELRPFINAQKDEIRALIAQYPEKNSFVINFKELEKFDYNLAQKAKIYPEDFLAAAGDIVSEMGLKSLLGKPIVPKIRIVGVDDDLLIQDLGAQHLNRLVGFKGLITRRGEIQNRVQLLTLVCDKCGETIKINLSQVESLPKKCPICRKGNLIKRYRESEFKDVQLIEVQELLERVDAGAPAAKIVGMLDGDLINKFVPGDIIEISGIIRLNYDSQYRKKKEYFPRYVEVLGMERIKRDFESIEVTKEEEKLFKEMAKDPEIERKLAESIFPDIYGYPEVKRALLLHLLGGTKGKRTASGTPLRANIHVLLIGDPGIAKTRMIQQVLTLAPKSIFVSGKTVSGVGLTASVEKDELSGQGWTLKAGALVLASGGIVGIDEFDKIDEEDRAALHEVMESGTVSIAKAGIVATLKADTTVLAAANPKYGRFQFNKPIPEQFNIPPSLLSRFDLIFPLMDILNEEKDKELAEHIIGLHTGQKGIQTVYYDRDTLRKYIAYAKKHIHPKITREAAQHIRDYYVRLRKEGENAGTVPITPRYLEGIIRLAEANAKARLSNFVEVRDAQAGINLLGYMMESILRDPETGKLDIDLLATGTTKSKRDKLATLDDLLRRLSKENEEVEINRLKEEAEKLGIGPREVEDYLLQLEKNGEIIRPRPGFIQLIF